MANAYICGWYKQNWVKKWIKFIYVKQILPKIDYTLKNKVPIACFCSDAKEDSILETFKWTVPKKTKKKFP